MLYFDEPVGQVAMQTTHKNTQRYNTPEHLIWYIILLYNRITMETPMVKSIQSIKSGRWSWHDNPISAADIGLSCQIQSLPSFQAPYLCSVRKLLHTHREASSFADCLKDI